MKKIFIVLVFLAIAAPGLAQTTPRYISLAPSTTEILFALGLDKEIVGVSSYCNYPVQAKNKESIGSFSQPNVEKILSLKPDYIFGTGLEQAAVIGELRRLKLNVYIADPKNIAELLDTIRQVGKITHRRKEAQDLIKNIENQIRKISSEACLIPYTKRPKVFVEIWHSPLTTAGKNSFIDELISLAGGINIAHNSRRPYTIFSQEEVIKANPDIIIITYMDKQAPAKLMEKRFGWEGISAVRNNRLYNGINPDLLLRPGPRVAEGLQEIYKRLYH
ncbi:MAG: cobalamin-binding protein [Candidatus Omnitrophica bacterium]|nr:cobalamin-binding protein [Candidatus Omnitrophota bacterium]